MLSGVKSGSIILFHNDLENTTEALPEILAELSAEGYEFVTVSDLIFWEDYTIDSNGVQHEYTKSSIELTPENAQQVLAEHYDELTEAGIGAEQIAEAAAALKSGEELPEEVSALISQYVNGAEITVPTAADITAKAK